jgi:hypothetical protein
MRGRGGLFGSFLSARPTIDSVHVSVNAAKSKLVRYSKVTKVPAGVL